MEDLLILILQALGEFLFELFAWLPWDYVWWWGPWDRTDRVSPKWVAVISSLIIGAGLGWLSLYLFPAVLIKWAWLRVAASFRLAYGVGADGADHLPVAPAPGKRARRAQLSLLDWALFFHRLCLDALRICAPARLNF